MKFCLEKIEQKILDLNALLTLTELCHVLFIRFTLVRAVRSSTFMRGRLGVERLRAAD